MRLLPLLLIGVALAGEARAAKPDAGTAACFRGGCGGELCSDRPDAVSACVVKDSERCYRAAACERQRDGHCGFTPSAALRRCLASADGGTSGEIQ